MQGEQLLKVGDKLSVTASKNGNIFTVYEVRPMKQPGNWEYWMRDKNGKRKIVNNYQVQKNINNKSWIKL